MICKFITIIIIHRHSAIPYEIIIIDDFLLRLLLLAFDTRTTPRPANQAGQHNNNNRRFINSEIAKYQ